MAFCLYMLKFSDDTLAADLNASCCEHLVATSRMLLSTLHQSCLYSGVFLAPALSRLPDTIHCCSISGRESVRMMRRGKSFENFEKRL